MKKILNGVWMHPYFRDILEFWEEKKEIRISGLGI